MRVRKLNGFLATKSKASHDAQIDIYLTIFHQPPRLFITPGNYPTTCSATTHRNLYNWTSPTFSL